MPPADSESADNHSDYQPTTRASKGNQKQTSKPKQPKKKATAYASKDGQGYAWEEEYKRSWDVLREDDSGSLEGAVNQLMANKRRRCAVNFLFVTRRRDLQLTGLDFLFFQGHTRYHVDSKRHHSTPLSGYRPVTCNDRSRSTAYKTGNVVELHPGVATFYVELSSDPKLTWNDSCFQ